jgi:hypothetical protein
MKRTKSLLVTLLLAAGAARAEVPFSGELRLRPEFRSNMDFNKNTQDVQSFVGSRLRITGSGLAAEDIAVKFTIQDTRNWGGEPGANAPIGLTDEGEALDVHEAFVDFQRFMKLPLALRAGRQELAYGDQRLVGHFGWNNQGRAFDAFKLAYAGNALSVDAWTAKRREENALAAGGRASLDRDFSGVYATLRAPVAFLDALDLYALHDREGNTTDDGNAFKPKSVYTFGLRAAGKTGALDYTVEAPFQTGDNGTVLVVSGSSTPVKVSANALAVKAGWTFPGSSELRLGAEYDYASGDDNAADDTSKTFQNLYPTNHPFYGYMDYQGWRNMSAWNLVASLKPTRRTFLLAQYWDFSLAEAKDGWYNAAGAAAGGLRAASAANTEKKVGGEVDLLFRFAQSRTVTWEAGVSAFMTGALIENRVADESDSVWAYLMLTTKF